jgi:hypothetical protein
VHGINVVLQELRYISPRRPQPQRSREHAPTLWIWISDANDFGAEALCCTTVPVAHQARADDRNPQSGLSQTSDFHVKPVFSLCRLPVILD